MPENRVLDYVENKFKGSYSFITFITFTAKTKAFNLVLNQFCNRLIFLM